MSVTKLELSNRITRNLGFKQPDKVKIVIDTFLDEILQALSEGDRIEIRGFGTFETKYRRPKVGRNPRTGEEIEIPEHSSPNFKFSQKAKNNLNKKVLKNSERRKVHSFNTIKFK